MTGTAPYPAFNGSEPCRNNPNAWVPKDELSQVAEYAKAHCGDCHVREACLAWGLANNEVGIYGGTTTAERNRLHGKPSSAPNTMRETTVSDVHEYQAMGYSLAETARLLGLHTSTVSKYRAMSRS